MGRRQPLAEMLAQASRAIDNGLHNEEIASRLAKLGYTAEKLQEGWALYETAEQLYRAQKDAYGAQYGATDAFEAKWAAAQKIYNLHLKLARLAFEDDRDAQTALGLSGKRPEAFGSWLRLAKDFYQTLLQDEALRTRLAEYGVTQEKLQEGADAVAAVEAAEHAQEEARGRAQELTRTRDEAIAALEAWMEDYLTVAQIALKDAPQLAEMLGILVRS